MKKLIFTLIITFISVSSYGQLKLPEIGTTETQAQLDLSKGLSNEDWFTVKDKAGKVTYQRYFKNTAVGIKHAFEAFDVLKSEWNAVSCKDGSMYPVGTINRDNTIYYEMLSLKIKAESAEINKTCSVKDDQVFGFNLQSIVVNDFSYLVIIVITNKRG